MDALRPFEVAAAERVATLSLPQKLHQLSGDTPIVRGLIGMIRAYNIRPFPAGGDPAAGIEPLMFSDGPRGIAVDHCTAFPVAMARGATWDPDLEARVGDVMGVEARSVGANFVAAVCINLLRHPGWGRAQETYGEDPVHVGTMGAAAVRGLERHVVACVKHFALNSIENSRFRVSVEIDDDVLHELYLPHFRACIAAGARAVMSAYNRVNGRYCGEHPELLTRILREDWQFRGLVMSDFFLGVRDGAAALQAGLDVEMPFRWRFGRSLERALRGGRVPEAAVDRACRRVLTVKLHQRTVGEPKRYGADRPACAAHRALAQEVAREAMVLLKNVPAAGAHAPLLPLAPAATRRLAVVGRLATAANLGDRGSSLVRAPEVVTPLAGLRARLHGQSEVVHDRGDRPARAAAAAADADAAVVVVGLGDGDEGEYLGVRGGDRRSLALHAADVALIEAVAAAQARTVVVLIGSGPLLVDPWLAGVPALLMAWYPGMQGGAALAEVLCGDAEPGGRLPCVWPRAAADLPPFDPTARHVRYDRFHGYRYQDRLKLVPAFPFGFGLGYTDFELGTPVLDEATVAADGVATVRVDVRNTGTRPGGAVVQLYAGRPAGHASAADRPPRALKAFRKVRLAAGAAAAVKLRLPVRDLARYDPAARTWSVPRGPWVLGLGTSAAESDLQELALEID